MSIYVVNLHAKEHKTTFSDADLIREHCKKQDKTIRIPKDLIEYLELRKTRKGFKSIAQMIAIEYRAQMIREKNH